MSYNRAAFVKQLIMMAHACSTIHMACSATAGTGRRTACTQLDVAMCPGMQRAARLLYPQHVVQHQKSRCWSKRLLQRRGGATMQMR